MKEIVVASDQLDQFAITFLHGGKNCQSYDKKIRTIAFLDQIFDKHGPKKMKDLVPPVTAVLDPEGDKLLLYDGNIRLCHAREKDYSLRAIVLTSPDDLFNYCQNHDVLWFRIRDFNELLEFMRIYAQYPREDDPDLPAYWRQKIDAKYWEDQKEQEIKMFGYDDDE